MPGVGRLGGVLLGVNSLLVLELLLSSSRLRPGMDLSLFLVLAGLLSGVGDLEKDLLLSLPFPVLTVALLLSAPDTDEHDDDGLGVGVREGLLEGVRDLSRLLLSSGYCFPCLCLEFLIRASL